METLRERRVGNRSARASVDLTPARPASILRLLLDSMACARGARRWATHTAHATSDSGARHDLQTGAVPIELVPVADGRERRRECDLAALDAQRRTAAVSAPVFAAEPGWRWPWAATISGGR